MFTLLYIVAGLCALLCVYGLCAGIWKTFTTERVSDPYYSSSDKLLFLGVASFSVGFTCFVVAFQFS